jgi:hypothetical protein
MYYSGFSDDFRLTFENEQDANTVINFITTSFSLGDYERTVLWISEEEYNYLVQNADLLEIEMIQDKEGEVD